MVYLLGALQLSLLLGRQPHVMCGAAEIAERIFERGKSGLPKSLASQFEIACRVASCLFVGRSDHPRAPSVVGAVRVHHCSCRALQRPRFLLSSLTRTTRTPTMTTVASLKPKLKPTRSFFPSSTLFHSLFSPLQSLSLSHSLYVSRCRAAK